MTEVIETPQTSQNKPKKSRAHVQFFMDPAVYRRMQACARAEGLTAVSWIRLAAIKELRRRKPSL